MRRAVAILAGSLMLSAIVTPAAAHDAPPLDLQATLDEFVGLAPGGAAIVTMRDGVMESAASGIADDTGRPFEVETPVRIWYSSGPLLAAMFLQAVDEGQLDLDATLGDYMPDAPFASDATISSLLDMTAGIPAYGDFAWFEAALEDMSRPWSYDDLYATIDPEQIEPGTYQLSATPYVLLLDVLQTLDGKDLNGVFVDRITGPVGMDSTIYLGQEGWTAPEGLAGGWAPELASGDPDQELTALDTWGGPASSAADLAAFLTALLDGEVISDEGLAMMFDPDATDFTPGWVPMASSPDWADDEGIDGFYVSSWLHPFGYEATWVVDPVTRDSIVLTTNNVDLWGPGLVLEILERWHHDDA